MKNQKISDAFQHLAWALVGQECDCGHNSLNPLARFCDRYVNGPNSGCWPETDDGYWTEDFEPKALVTKCACAVSRRVKWIADAFQPPVDASDGEEM